MEMMNWLFMDGGNNFKGFGSHFRTASQMNSGNNKMGELYNGISGGKYP